MRAEFAPRISVDDIRNFNPPIICLDIRPPEEWVFLKIYDNVLMFCRFAIRNHPGSISINLKETTFKELTQYKGKHITIIGDRGDNAAKVFMCN